MWLVSNHDNQSQSRGKGWATTSSSQLNSRECSKKEREWAKSTPLIFLGSIMKYGVNSLSKFHFTKSAVGAGSMQRIKPHVCHTSSSLPAKIFCWDSSAFSISSVAVVVPSPNQVYVFSLRGFQSRDLQQLLVWLDHLGF